MEKRTFTLTVLILAAPIFYSLFGAAFLPSIIISFTMSAIAMRIHKVELNQQKNLFNFLVQLYRIWSRNQKQKKTSKKK